MDNKAYVLIAQEIVTVRKSVLGEPHGSIGHERDKIIAALDMVFTGILTALNLILLSPEIESQCRG